MKRQEIIDKLNAITQRLTELLAKEIDGSITADELEDAVVLGEWADELALEEVED